MIEPLRTERESNEGFVYDEPLTLDRINAKLNEVIEAVNQIQQFINRDNPLQPPFPPVVRDVPSVTEVLARASENMFARLLPDSGSHD